VETPIVSDQPGVAPITDPDLVNPCGPNDLIAIGADEYTHGLVALVHPTAKGHSHHR
jgi:hypothetical protein